MTILVAKTAYKTSQCSLPGKPQNGWGKHNAISVFVTKFRLSALVFGV